MESVCDSLSLLVTILAAIFGAGFPLIISCIERIDEKYNSTILSVRFKSEKEFKHYKWILLMNVLLAIVSPFVRGLNLSAGYLVVIVQAVGCIALVCLVFQLFLKVMLYYEPEELQEVLLGEYEDSLKQNCKVKERVTFEAWVDSVSPMIKAMRKGIVDALMRGINIYRDNKGSRSYDKYFFAQVTRINEMLCDSVLSIEGETFAKDVLIVFVPHEKCSKEEYDLYYANLWNNVLIWQMKGKTQWLFSYWEKVESLSNNRQIDEDDSFFEVHLMICVLILYSKEYKVLKKMLLMSNSSQNPCRLIPFKLNDIFKMFISLYRKDAAYFSTHYPMIGMIGISDGKILGLSFKLLVLLMFLSKDNQLDADSCKGGDFVDIQTTIKEWIENRLNRDKELLNEFGISKEDYRSRKRMITERMDEICN
jgi:hypothetical protein